MQRPVIWIGEKLAQSVSDGDQAAMLRALLVLAKHWMEKGGSSLKWRDGVSMSDVAGAMPGHRQSRTAEQRAFLAAGCDLYDLVSSSAEGRKALGDLVLQPVAKDRDGE